MIASLSKAFVSDQSAELDAVDQGGDAHSVEAMPRQELKANQIAERIGERQDFAGHAALVGLWPGSKSPFCALAAAMDLDDGGVDHGELHIRIIRYSLEKPLENIGLHPVAIALEDRVPLAEKLGKVAPRTASASDPKHGLNKQPIVGAAPPRIARLSQAIRLHLRPLGVGHYESVHPKLESRQTHNGNLEASVRSAARKWARPGSGSH
jgi:hypothetical protein